MQGVPQAVSVTPAPREDSESGMADARRDPGLDPALIKPQRAVTADPDSAWTYAGLAEVQWQKYFLTRDADLLDKFTESERQAELRDPDAAAVHRVEGILEANSSLYEKATASFQRAIELEP